MVLLLAGLAVFTAIQSARLEAVHPPQGRFAQIAGGRLHYIERMPQGEASGATIVLLHGASGNARDIDLALGGKLAARGHRVISFDRPGHGWSDRPHGSGDASPALQASMIVQGMAVLGIDRAVIVGHSLAGAVATNLALDHRDRVAGLMLLSGVTHPWEGGVSWQNHVATAPVIGDIVVRTIVVPLGLVTISEVTDRVFAPHHPPAGYLQRASIPLVLRPQEFQANAEDVMGLLDFVQKQAPRYGEISVPTVVMTADKDTIVYPQTHSRPIARQIKQAKLVILPGAGHMPHHTATDRVVAELEELVARVAPAPAG